MTQIYGYARISSKDQSSARQTTALLQFGVPYNNIFVDYCSGKDFDRPAYQQLLSLLRPDDIFVVKSIDRLGRNYSDIIEQWRTITKVKGVAIVVLDTPILDTRRDKDIIGTLVSDLVLQIMSAFAQIERDFIKQRQAEGIAVAKANGVKFGRDSLPVPDNFPEVLQQWQAGKISARTAGKLLNVSHSTFLKWAHSA
jgi:DNA invertase Pin-like site-specific DNA recombinase